MRYDKSTTECVRNNHLLTSAVLCFVTTCCTEATNQRTIIIFQWAINNYIISILMCADVTQLLAEKQSGTVMLYWSHLCCYFLQSKHKLKRIRGRMTVKNIHYRIIFCGDSLQSFTLPQVATNTPWTHQSSVSLCDSLEWFSH